jgi:hypothetical protein
MVPLHYGLCQDIKIESAMNKSTRLIVTAAAVAGLYAGSTASRAYASGVAGSSNSMLKDGTAGTHACKGQNACKGQGGCKASDNGCKGQNSCKGKGGCSTASSDQAPTPTKAV